MGSTYMPKQYADLIIYSMCTLSIFWAIVQTVLIQRMEIVPSKIKVHILSPEELAKKSGDSEKGIEAT